MSSSTVKLLRECDAGIKMGIASIDEVLDNVKDDNLREILIDYKDKHSQLEEDAEVLLNEYHEDGKEPNPMAKAMSWIKTNTKMMVSPTDETISDLITDGCNMGVKSLNRYLNEYKAAEEKAKDITKRLINLEEKLAVDIREYL